MTDRESALEALGRWRAQRPWARRDPATLSVASVEPVGPTQVTLTSRYEARGVRYELSPAPSRPVHNEAGPDPWSVRLEHPDGAPVGHEVSTPISGTTVHMDCGLCSATGEQRCATCDGQGRIQRGRASYTCHTCHGRGQVACEQCGGSGGLIGRPSVWSRIDRHERILVHESGDLPLDAFFAVSEGAQGGDVIHRQEAPQIVDLRRDGTYRDAASQADPIRDLVQRLGAEPGLPDGVQLLGQRLEIRRVPAFKVQLEGGPTIWVYGDPPKLSPPGALPSTALRAAKIAPVALTATGVAIWLLLRAL